MGFSTFESNPSEVPLYGFLTHPVFLRTVNLITEKKMLTTGGSRLTVKLFPDKLFKH